MISTDSQVAFNDTLQRGSHRGEAKMLIVLHQAACLGCKMVHQPTGRDLITLQQRPLGGQPTTHIYIYERHMDENTDTQAWSEHKVNHALGYTHIVVDAHLDDYSQASSWGIIETFQP